MSHPAKNASLTLIRNVRDEDYDEEQFKPLEWGLLRRLFSYAAPVRRKLRVLIVLSTIRLSSLWRP